MPAQELHPDLNDEEVRELLREGVDVFNEGRFFDSHEYFEEIWRSTNPEPRDLFHGLVQVAAGLHIWHHRRKADPAARVIGRGVSRLPYPKRLMGVVLFGGTRQGQGWVWGAHSRQLAVESGPHHGARSCYSPSGLANTRGRPRGSVPGSLRSLWRGTGDHDQRNTQETSEGR